MKQCLCDRCKKEGAYEFRIYYWMYDEYILKADLCKKCYHELKKMLKKWVKIT